MLMESEGIYYKHRVSIFETAAKSFYVEEAEFDTSKRTSSEIVQNGQYKTVASIMRQFFRRDTPRNPGNAMNSNQGKLGIEKYSFCKDEHLSRMKEKFAFRRCGKFGHWKHEQNEDGTLNNGVPSHEKPKDDVVSSEKAKMDVKESKNEDSKQKVALGFTSSIASSTLVLNAHIGSCCKLCENWSTSRRQCSLQCNW